jgi:cold shock CspA family protein
LADFGKITKINNDLGYGFVSIPGKGEVFFSQDTQFLATSFEQLKINDTVQLLITETERGLFAKSLSIEVSKTRSRPADITL